MKFQTLIRTSGLFALQMTVGSILLASPAALADDCQFVPATQSGVNVPVKNMMGGAWVHEMHVKDCKPQCIARIFCASDHPELKGPDIPMQKKFDAAKTVNCDANPSASEIGDKFVPSCKTADECMKQAKDENWRIVETLTTPNPGSDSFQHNGAVFHVQYGLDRAHPDAKIPLYSFPSLNGSKSDECRICASPVTLGEGVWNHTACPANTEEPLGCRNANDCSNYRADDPTAPAMTAIPVQPSQCVHYVVPGTPPKGAPAGTAKPGEHK